MLLRIDFHHFFSCENMSNICWNIVPQVKFQGYQFLVSISKFSTIKRTVALSFMGGFCYVWFGLFSFFIVFYRFLVEGNGFFVEPLEGFEPSTRPLQGACSAFRATVAQKECRCPGLDWDIRDCSRFTQDKTGSSWSPARWCFFQKFIEISFHNTFGKFG